MKNIKRQKSFHFFTIVPSDRIRYVLEVTFDSMLLTKKSHILATHLLYLVTDCEW